MIIERASIFNAFIVLTLGCICAMAVLGGVPGLRSRGSIPPPSSLSSRTPATESSSHPASPVPSRLPGTLTPARSIAPASTSTIGDRTPPATRGMLYTFNDPGVLLATTRMEQSSSPYFWISSGGRLIIRDGIGRTIQGALPSDDPSRITYARVNPLDTEEGRRPQNTFRLVTKSTWGNAEEWISFRISEQNLTDTPNRDRYSGVFLMSRYRDKDNLYYAGVRDDGLAVIKKKIRGTYYTLGTAKIFGNPSDYDRSAHPTLLPIGAWIGIGVTTRNEFDGSISIALSLDRSNSGTWEKVLSVKDDGVGGPPLVGEGHGGVRTDYKDVEFENMRFAEL